MDDIRLLKTAINAAEKGAGYIRSMFGALTSEDIQLKAKNDYVTMVDRESERIIIETLKLEFPAHRFLGEESGASGGGEAYQWIIDPLDGTKNFIKGVPVFCVSVAVALENKIIAGCVIDAVSGDIYSALSGKGAYKNDNKLGVSDQLHIEDSFFATGFPHRIKDIIPQYTKTLEILLQLSSGGRRTGAAALDLCWLAQGTFDFFFEVGLGPWDVAAGSLIVIEAGGQVTDFNGESDYLFGQRIIASNGRFHRKLLGIIPQYLGDITLTDKE